MNIQTTRQTLVYLYTTILIFNSDIDKKMFISYTLGFDYRVVSNRYSRLLFTIEGRLCANLSV